MMLAGSGLSAALHQLHCLLLCRPVPPNSCPCQVPNTLPVSFLPVVLPRYLNDNQLTGSIPVTWGEPGAFPQLSLLRVDSNRLDGTLPAAWGSAGGGSGSLPSLLVL